MEKAFHINLRKARNQKDWTRERAGQACGVKLSTYSAWEEGRSCPTTYGLITVAIAFGIENLVSFVTDPDFNVIDRSALHMKEITKDGLALQRGYSIAPIREKLAVNILLGLVDIE